MGLNKQIGKRVKLLRGMRKLTQENVAAAAGVSAQQIQKYERGENSISVERLRAICAFFRIPWSFFLEDIILDETYTYDVKGLNEGQASYSVEESKSELQDPISEEEKVELSSREETFPLLRYYYHVDPKRREKLFLFIKSLALDKG